MELKEAVLSLRKLVSMRLKNFDMQLLTRYAKQLDNLCQKHHVEVMYVFGSVVTGRSSSDSDIDLLVKFLDINPLEYFDNYMSFKESLEQLFLRSIDLVEEQTIRNPILKRSIDRNKVMVYERKNSKMAV
ncbi:MAG: nucleotidyltransferase domain-containing protein [Tunicatimonas sp.]